MRHGPPRGIRRTAPNAGNTGQLSGATAAVGPRPGRKTVVMGDEVYLWILVFLEVSAVMFLRSAFSRYHGG